MNDVDKQTWSDAHLLRCYAQQRDVAAFEVLIERHQTVLLRLAHALLGDAALAQDAVQEGFLRLSRDAQCLALGWQADRSVGAWLNTVIRHWCIDMLRQRRFTALSPDDVGATADAGVTLTATTHEPVWAAVAELPALERAVVCLRYRDELSYQDIAHQLDKTPTHVGVLLHQALQRLRRYLVVRTGDTP